MIIDKLKRAIQHFLGDADEIIGVTSGVAILVMLTGIGLLGLYTIFNIIYEQWGSAVYIVGLGIAGLALGIAHTVLHLKSNTR